MSAVSLENDLDEIFSIIMPAYNASEYIAESITSVINQSYQNWVLYVIDDASTDSTSFIVNSFNDCRIKYYRLSENSGVASARNIGIKSAKGKFIAFLDSDDIWTFNKLEKQLFFLNKGYDVVCSGYLCFSGSTDNVVSKRNFPEIINFNNMLKKNNVGNLTGVYNASKIGKFFQKDVGHEDYLMWLSVIQSSNEIYCVPEYLAYYRLSSSSLSSNKIKASRWQWNIYREHLQFNIFKSLYFWFFYVLLSLKKR